MKDSKVVGFLIVVAMRAVRRLGDAGAEQSDREGEEEEGSRRSRRVATSGGPRIGSYA